MKLTGGRWENNEIILTTDVNANVSLLLEDFDTVSDALGADMVVTGLEVSEATVPDMTVQVSEGIAKDTTTGYLLCADATNLTITAADLSNDRYDIIEMARLEDTETSATRQFKDASTGVITSSSIDTVKTFAATIAVKTGTPGSAAPTVDAGYLKIAEVYVPASSTTVVDANIYNCDAEAEGETNTDWTTAATSVYRNGSTSVMKTYSFQNRHPLVTTLTSTGSYTVTSRPYQFVILDTTSAIVTATLSDGTFSGQIVDVVCDDAGSYYGFVLGTNIVSLGLPVAPGKRIQLKWYDTLGWTYADPNVINPQTISTTSTITLGPSNHLIELDTSLGAMTATLPSGDFIGQQLDVYTTGSGVAQIAGTGLYTNNIYQTNNTGKLRIVWTGSEWRADNQVTADYVSSGTDVQQWSNGRIRQSVVRSGVTGSSGTGVSFWDTGMTVPVPFVDPTKVILTGVAGRDAATSLPIDLVISNRSGWTTTVILFRIFIAAAVGTAVLATVAAEEKYA